MQGGASGTQEDARARLTDLLSSRASLHYGVPVGALLLPLRHVQPCRELLQKHLGKLKFAAVDRVATDTALVHLPPAAAAALDDPLCASEALSAELMPFLTESSATYLSGVRVHDAALGRATVLPDQSAVISSPPPFTFAEVFAGIGGFRLGLEPLGGRCVWASEIDPLARATYRKNWPDGGDLLVGDVTGVYSSDLPAVDVLTAGFPCQPFSGRSAGATRKVRRICLCAYHTPPHLSQPSVSMPTVSLDASFGTGTR